MSLIRSRDAALYVEESGSGEPLVLLPGLLGSIESHWRRFIPELSGSFHTITMDLRGHGRSNNPGGHLSLRVLMDDLLALYDALGIAQARICGYSLGGYVGLMFGMHNPGRVRSLLMHGTKFYWTETAVGAMLRGFDPDAMRARVPAFAEALQREHEPGSGPDGWMDLLHSARAFIEQIPGEAITEDILPLADFPVLVTACENDEMLEADEAQRLAESLPKGRHKRIAGCKHPIQSVVKGTLLEVALEFFLNDTQ